MNEVFLLFEIGDKVIGVEVMYFVFLTLGATGFVLGFWRWWASFIWLIFPTLFFAICYLLIQIAEINYLYENIIRELGESYIWHSYLSVTAGGLLNIAGLFVTLFNSKKSILR